MTAVVRRWLSLALLLALVAVTVPDSAHTEADFALLKVEHAQVLDKPRKVIWMLTLGSDAREGQSVTHSRADSIHLVGVNTRTGKGVIIGLPRDSYVPIPGHGSDKINASMVYGGPQLTARVVQRISGVRLDYVFLTDFGGFAAMVHELGGIRVRPPMAMSDLGHTFAPREQWMNGGEALGFSRIRHGLPGGDFDRTLNQGRVLKAGLERARALADDPGKFEQMMLRAITRMDTNVPPAELYRLGRVMLTIHPNGVRNCRITGGFGSAGGASIVVPDLDRLRRLVRSAGADATLDRGC
jgi:polyisoprenyl-teichoic acid--peptidoglycan teichoic acid transferase